MKILANHARARFDYRIVSTMEGGIVLKGSEVKSVRNGQMSLAQSFVVERGRELFLHQAHISPYAQASLFNHHAVQDRKLLLHRKEINKIMGAITRKGMTALVTKIYLNDKGYIKAEIALGVGTKHEDKRHLIKEREWKRQQQRVLKTHHKDG